MIYQSKGYTNREGLPRSICMAIEKDRYDLDKTDMNMISVTTLIDTPKQRVLKARHEGEYTTDYADENWKLLGNAVHYILEQLDEKDEFMIEQRAFVKYGGKIITGKPDIVDLKENNMQDAKVTSVWHIINQEREGFPEYHWQLNINRWLYKDFFKVEVGELMIIPVLRDWSKAKAQYTAGYPKSGMVPIPITVYDDERIERYIKERIGIHAQYENLPDDEVPECSPDERWARGGKFSVMKEGRKTALKNCNTEEEAVAEMSWRLDEKPKDKLWIRETKAEDIRCTGYCEVAPFCHYYKEHYLIEGGDDG